MTAWHPELGVITEALDQAAGALARRAADLDEHHHPDDWITQIDGEWHTRRPGRARGSVSLGSEGFATRAEALEEVLAEAHAERRRVAALAARGDGRG